MSADTTWHVDPSLLTAYLDARLDPARSSSVEAHLPACARCRASVAELLAPSHQRELDQLWSEVVDAVDRRPRNFVERALVLMGVREHVARVLAVTPALRVSWLAAVIGALAFAVWMANVGLGDRGAGSLVFLVITPLVPIAGIATAFGPAGDPTHEIGRAAPLPAHRVLLWRSIVVICTSTVLTAIASLGLPNLGWIAAAWLLPSLALAAATLALSTWVSPPAAATVAGAGWLAVVAVVLRPGRWAAHDLVAQLPINSASDQLSFLVLLMVGVVVFAMRAQQLDHLAVVSETRP